MNDRDVSTIIVTGGAGFIGSALVRYLIRSTNHRIVNLDKLTYASNIGSLRDIADSERYCFEQGDICNLSLCQKIINDYQPAAIMHLAAESHVDRSIDAPAEFIQTNVVGTCNLLQAAHHYWKGLPKESQESFRFHHISTDEVYGDLEEGDPTFTESNAYKPSSPYSASKASSDHFVRAWYRTYGLPTIISNCSNNYGPYHFPEKFIPHVIINALFGHPIPIYGDGQQIRDWLYVDDHVRALYTVLRNGVNGETYNIGGRNEMKNIDVVHHICAILDRLRPKENSYADQISFVTDRPGHDRRYAIDNGKIKAGLGWEPIETFDSGIEKTVRWYLDNEQWWRDILNGTYNLGRLGQAS